MEQITDEIKQLSNQINATFSSTLPESLTQSESGRSKMEDIDDEHTTHNPVRKSIRQACGTLTMMLSANQILYCYVCDPDALNV
jgi:hypothetical protein